MKILLILALILNVEGFGEVTEQGMDTVITATQTDPLSGKQRMELKGSLLANGPLTVTVTRSQTGLSDEFCCANQCTAGNGETIETLSFNPDEFASWYVHYNPSPDSDVRMTYRFSDNTDTLELRVRYLHQSEGLILTPSRNRTLKILRNGHIRIIREDNVFNLQGTKITE